MSSIPPPLIAPLEKVTMIFKKIAFFFLSLRTHSPKNIPTLLRPGTQLGEWQRWSISSKKEKNSLSSTAILQEIKSHKQSELILLDAGAPPPLNISKLDWITGVPTRDLIAIPLWVASQGNLQELVMLELSSKHLLQRGMSEGLKMITLGSKASQENQGSQGERTLVVVFAPTTTPSLATAPYLKEAHHFEAAARLLPIDKVDLIVWKELGEICFGFVKENQYLWFSGSGENKINLFLLDLIKRMACHLQAESVLETMPRTARLIGSFSLEERKLLEHNLEIEETACEYISELTSPVIPTPLLDLPSLKAREARIIQAKRNRIKKIASLAFIAYFFFLFVGIAHLIFKKTVATHFSHQLLAASTTLEKATQEITQWQEFRFAVDPTTYTLDLLTAIGSQIHGEKIRLISLSYIDGLLQITGEANDVSAAYHFLELIKNIPEFHEYKWTNSQPKLAGKNSVRFEIEGSLPHASTSSK